MTSRSLLVRLPRLPELRTLDLSHSSARTLDMPAQPALELLDLRGCGRLRGTQTDRVPEGCDVRS